MLTYSYIQMLIQFHVLAVCKPTRINMLLLPLRGKSRSEFLSLHVNILVQIFAFMK